MPAFSSSMKRAKPQRIAILTRKILLPPGSSIDATSIHRIIADPQKLLKSGHPYARSVSYSLQPHHDDERKVYRSEFEVMDRIPCLIWMLRIKIRGQMEHSTEERLSPIKYKAISSGILVTHCYDIIDSESSELTGSTIVTVTDTITVSGPRILLWFAAKKAISAQQMLLDHLKKNLENRTPS